MSSKWLIVPFFLFLTVSSSAQELGIFVAQGWSGNTETGNPLGFGVIASQNLSGSIAVGISYEQFSNKRSYEGVTSGDLGFSPVTERIEGTVRMTAWKLHLCYYPLRGERVSLGVGSAVSTNSITISKTGVETGRGAGETGGHKFGFGFSLLTKVVPATSLPLAVTVMAQRHFMGQSTTIATDVANPVNGSIAITSLSLGVNYCF